MRFHVLMMSNMSLYESVQ